MQSNSRSSTTPSAGGRFASALDESLDRALTSGGIALTDLMTAGWTVEELARAVASTPPFSEALVAHVRRRLLATR